MVQAARSGVQNIAEGSQASGTSKKTELKLTNVARASLEELLLDYEDYLRQNKFSLWDRTDPRRKIILNHRFTTADDFVKWVKNQRGSVAENAANGILVLIGITCALLSRQITAQANAFEQEGGFTERLYRMRTAARKTQR
jgi:four helix bundle suffix protein